MSYIVLLGRILFSFIFISSGFSHFSEDAVAYAANEGVPMASILVPASGVLALVGGLSILLGFKARLGAWLIVIFLVPVTWMMHAFWLKEDPNAALIHKIMFMKNLAMLGAALLISYFGAGPLSLDHDQAKLKRKK